MLYFDYRAKVSNSNKVFRGIVTADSTETALDNLKSKGLTIVEIFPIIDFLSIRKTLYSFSDRITKKTIQEFFEQLAFMLDTDIALYDALTILRDNGASKKIMALARPIAECVRKGLSLHEAMEKTKQFTLPIIQQVKSGEDSGNVPQTLNRISAELARDMEFKKKIKGAMTYPIIICVVMIMVLWVLLTFVVPNISKTIIGLGGELPLITKIVIAVSNIISTATPFIIISIAFAAFLYKYLCRNKIFKYNMDKTKIQMPMFGKLIEKLELSRFCKSLASMQESGITLVRSLNITQNALKNTYIKKMVEKSARLVEVSGLNLSLALAKGGKFPELMIQLIDVGVNTGRTDEVLNRIANQYEKDIDSSIKKITSLIEPLMIVIVGTLAGTVVVSMFLPLMAVMDSF